MQPALELRNLSIGFGGNQVLKEISLNLKQQEFLSIIGPNGAGKTTLFQIIGGQYKADNGQIVLNGNDITAKNITKRSLLGIGRTFQRSSLYPNLSVEENISLPVRVQKKVHRKFLINSATKKEVHETVMEVLELLELDEKVSKKAGELGHADQRKLELGILLGMKPRLLLLDEPAAGMSVEEIPLLMKILNSLKQSRKYSIILVEHKIDLVLALSDRVVVLHNGHVLADETPAEIINNQGVQHAYLGKS